MFTSVLGALTSALPKYFIWGAYVPVLIFSFLNTGLVYLLSSSARGWLQKQLAGSSSPLTIATAFVFTVAVAYLVSAVNDFLRELLEGRYLLWPLWPLFSALEQQRRYGMQTDYLSAVQRRYELRLRMPTWQRWLLDAANDGVRQYPQVPPRLEDGLGPDAVHRTSPATERYDPEQSHAARELGRLRRAVGNPTAIEMRQIDDAVRAMARALATHNKLVDTALARDHKELLLILDTIDNTATAREFDATLALNMAFSGDMPAATRMGNVADAMHGYTMKRYGIDLNVLMSRLQTVLQSSGKGYEILLDAKTQLDFLIACCCFSGLTTAVWAIVLLTLGGSPSVYTSIAVLGPLVTVLFYRVAVESYLAYSVSVRACVDVNRFALLRALELPLPITLNAELRLWRTLSESAVSGATAELSYEHPKP